MPTPWDRLELLRWRMRSESIFAGLSRKPDGLSPAQTARPRGWESRGLRFTFACKSWESRVPTGIRFPYNAAAIIPMMKPRIDRHSRSHARTVSLGGAQSATFEIQSANNLPSSASTWTPCLVGWHAAARPPGVNPHFSSLTGSDVWQLCCLISGAPLDAPVLWWRHPSRTSCTGRSQELSRTILSTGGLGRVRFRRSTARVAR